MGMFQVVEMGEDILDKTLKAQYTKQAEMAASTKKL